MLLPVVPGDVFATIDPTQNVLKKDLVWAGELEIDKSYFMLLGQLCDVVPRGDTGESATNMAFLVKFSVKAAKGHDKNLPRNQLNSGRVGWMTVGDLALHFDFRSVLSANMLALRLCSYNRNGVAYLKESDSAEDMWSLASIARAKIKSIERFASGSKVPPELQYYATAFHSDDTARGLSISGRRGRRLFKYPVRRVCRIREVEASEALGALERYWRRPAKPNYFVN